MTKSLKRGHRQPGAFRITLAALVIILHGCAEPKQTPHSEFEARLIGRPLPVVVRELVASSDVRLPEWLVWPEADECYSAEIYQDGFGNRFALLGVSFRNPFPSYVGPYGYYFIVNESVKVLGGFTGGTGGGGFGTGVIGGRPRDINGDGWLECPAAFTRDPFQQQTQPEKKKEMIVWQLRPDKIVKLLDVLYVHLLEGNSSPVIPLVDDGAIVIGPAEGKPFVSFHWHSGSHVYVGPSGGEDGAPWTVLPYEPVPRQ
jgi:hypothetical protein